MEKELEGSQDSRIESLWSSLDEHGKGQIDVKALKKGLEKIDHPLKNAEGLLRAVIKAADGNDDGAIELSEFRIFIRHAEKQLWDLFKSIDRDQNNRLSKRELAEAFERSNIPVPSSRLDDFFERVDSKGDGAISFDEWRDFLLFMPAHEPGLKAVLSYFSAGVKVNPEGDVSISDEPKHTIGTTHNVLSDIRSSLFGALAIILSPPIRDRPPELPATSQHYSSNQPHSQHPDDMSSESQTIVKLLSSEAEKPQLSPIASQHAASKLLPMPPLTAFLPGPGFFAAGAMSGIVSRTTTAPLDRLKVYLIAQTDNASQALDAVKGGKPLQATKHAVQPLMNACKELWAAGGMRSLFAGNGLNVIKVAPESAVKFGSYEAMKLFAAQLEGHSNPKDIRATSSFIAGGIAGMISQAVVYPLDTLKFRMQCETVKGGLHGHKLIMQVGKQMMSQGLIKTSYRGLTMGLVGMFPYAALDLGTFEFIKKAYTKRNVKKYGLNEVDAAPGAIATAAIGGFSGAFGASAVYPLNLLRTRLQTQGTAIHKRTYTGWRDVLSQTIKSEGLHGLYKGLTPNLLKVAPAVSITYVTYEYSKRLFGLH